MFLPGAFGPLGCGERTRLHVTDFSRGVSYNPDVADTPIAPLDSLHFAVAYGVVLVFRMSGAVRGDARPRHAHWDFEDGKWDFIFYYFS